VLIYATAVAKEDIHDMVLLQVAEAIGLQDIRYRVSRNALGATSDRKYRSRSGELAAGWKL
jgi:hypothetical protein